MRALRAMGLARPSRAPAARGLLAVAAARAAAWLVEPAPAAPPEAFGDGGGSWARHVVAVCGTAPRCGATTIARALAVELALRDPDGAAAVAARDAAAGLPLATAAAARLAAAVGEAAGAPARASGRLCLLAGADAAAAERAVGDLAPLVIDAGTASGAGGAVSLATAAVLVAPPHAEPALAAVVADRLARVGPRPFVVLNCGPAEGRWSEVADVEVPRSRAAARLATAGRSAAGEFGDAIARLAAEIRSAD